MWPGAASKDSEQQWYAVERLASDSGYRDQPAVDDGFLFLLPRLYRYSGRIVATKYGRWEIWSPNSVLSPFYPGVRNNDGNETVELASERAGRRYDGHLGRYDFTVHPQAFDPLRPWRGYILRPSEGRQMVASRPEYYSLLDIWRSLPNPGIVRGTLDSQALQALKARIIEVTRMMDSLSNLREVRYLLWSKRPLYPTEDDLTKLCSPLLFEDAVDWFGELTRGLRDRVAWCEFAGDYNVERFMFSVDEARRRDVMVARDNHLGVWVNGVEEESVLMMLHLSIPCFIIHELNEAERVVVSRASILPSFAAQSDVVHLGARSNRFDLLASNQGLHGIAARAKYGGEHLPTRSSLERALSSPVAQGWRGHRPGRHEGLRCYQRPTSTCSPEIMKHAPDKVAPTPSLLAWESRQAADDGYDSDVEGPPLERVEEVAIPFSDFAAVPLEKVCLDEQKVLWIRPLPIQPHTSGKWSKWFEVMGKDGYPTMESQSHKAKKPSGSFVYYDRINRRQLYFSRKLLPPLGCVSNITTFGLPPPPRIYRDGPRRVKATAWVYTSLAPHGGQTQLRAQTPSPMHLPDDPNFCGYLLDDPSPPHLQPLSAQSQDPVTSQLTIQPPSTQTQDSLVLSATGPAQMQNPITSQPLSTQMHDSLVSPATAPAQMQDPITSQPPSTQMQDSSVSPATAPAQLQDPITSQPPSTQMQDSLASPATAPVQMQDPITSQLSSTQIEDPLAVSNSSPIPTSSCQPTPGDVTMKDPSSNGLEYPSPVLKYPRSPSIPAFGRPPTPDDGVSIGSLSPPSAPEHPDIEEYLLQSHLAPLNEPAEPSMFLCMGKLPKTIERDQILDRLNSAFSRVEGIQPHTTVHMEQDNQQMVWMAFHSQDAAIRARGILIDHDIDGSALHCTFTTKQDFCVAQHAAGGVVKINDTLHDTNSVAAGSKRHFSAVSPSCQLGTRSDTRPQTLAWSRPSQFTSMHHLLPKPGGHPLERLGTSPNLIDRIAPQVPRTSYKNWIQDPGDRAASPQRQRLDNNHRQALRTRKTRRGKRSGKKRQDRDNDAQLPASDEENAKDGEI